MNKRSGEGSEECVVFAMGVAYKCCLLLYNIIIW